MCGLQVFNHRYLGSWGITQHQVKSHEVKARISSVDKTELSAN